MNGMEDLIIEEPESEDDFPELMDKKKLEKVIVNVLKEVNRIHRQVQKEKNETLGEKDGR